MIKSLHIFLILMLFPVFGMAQSYEAALLLGANFAQFDGDGFGGYNKLGLHTGVRISRQLKEQWAWGFELDYTQKGSKKVVDPDVIDFTAERDFHYLEVPVLAFYQYDPKWQFHGGVSFGVLVFNQREDGGILSVENKLRPTEGAFQLGGSYAVDQHWNVQLRHSYSIASVRKQGFVYNNILQFGFAGWYHNLFTLSLVYDLGQ